MIPTQQELRFSGRIARFFQSAQITPLIAIVAFLLGVFAVLVTPREEEPQIDVTMANVLIAFPGASVADVEAMVALPAEQVLSQIRGIEHVYAVSRPGLAILTVQYKVGVGRTEALVRLHDTLNANSDWLPRGLGVLPPLVKPKGIDDVPVVTLTLVPRTDEAASPEQLRRVAQSLEVELKRVEGTREVAVIGAAPRAVNVYLDPERLTSVNLTVADIRQSIAGANVGAPAGDLLAGQKSIQVEVGRFFSTAEDVGELIVATRSGRPVYLRDVARIVDGPPPPGHYVWHGAGGQEQPAVTVTVTKKAGENAIDVAEAVSRRVEGLRNVLIPEDIEVVETRNYGRTANDKARQLIQKLLFATAGVIALVFVALGRREAAIVGVAVILTLTVTLFASWAWGFTLNRVSLFALIFSIGILVDDAIVVVESIHRHRLMSPDKSLVELIPRAVDEVGGPTILATLTVIAALLPMAFVTGLMGPYMSPIPINASMGMLLSLAIAFIVTPWLARVWLGQAHHAHAPSRVSQSLERIVRRIYRPLLDAGTGTRARIRLALAVLALIGVSLVLPIIGWVQLKMLPFDNKSEFQVVLDMPADATLEATAAALSDITHYLGQQPEVRHYQAYVGTAAPINFNGLVRQYYLRQGATVGDIQVNLVDRSLRKEKSHAIATRLRVDITAIAARHGGNAKVVEVPPGPPVLSPIVAEIYGPEDEGRRALAKAVRQVFETTPGVVDVDDSTTVRAPRILLVVDRSKAAALGIPQQAIAAILAPALGGDAVSFLHDGSKYAVPVRLSLPPDRQGELDALLGLRVRGQDGRSVPVRELVDVVASEREAPRYRKDLLPVTYVVGDMAGKVDSPLYGMFGMRGKIARITTPTGKPEEYFIRPPAEAWSRYAIKWDGEWQITYETFRDMGIAYAIGLVLIYLLVVAQFGSYLIPLIIMAPIPLTVIGVMPGHALLGASFTATSMIGMIALAGIIVRNSILLVDYVNVLLAEGRPIEEAVVDSTVARAQPILLTALAAMSGALFILDDPIFNGLAISLIFGIGVSTVLTLVVIPILYYLSMRGRGGVRPPPDAEPVERPASSSTVQP